MQRSFQCAAEDASAEPSAAPPKEAKAAPNAAAKEAPEAATKPAAELSKKPTFSSLFPVPIFEKDRN